MTTLFFGIHTIEFMETLFYFAKKKKKTCMETQAAKGSQLERPFKGFCSVFPSTVRHPVVWNICGFQRETEVSLVCLKRARDSSVPLNAASGNPRWLPPGSEC